MYSITPFFLTSFLQSWEQKEGGGWGEGNKVLSLCGSRKSPSRPSFYRFKVERLNSVCASP